MFLTTAIIIEFYSDEKSPLENIYQIKKLLEKMKDEATIEGYSIGLITSEDVEAELLEAEL